MRVLCGATSLGRFLYNFVSEPIDHKRCVSGASLREIYMHKSRFGLQQTKHNAMQTHAMPRIRMLTGHSFLIGGAQQRVTGHVFFA